MNKIIGSLFSFAFVVVLISATDGFAGTVNGVISGKGGEPAKINVTKDHAVCGKTPLIKENLLVSGSGGLKNAVVEIVGAGEAGAKKVVLAQDGCRFTPHVVVVGPESEVEAQNRDGITHNFHSYGFENDPVNFSQPGDMKVKVVKGENFELPEVVQIRCDIHEWMEAWVVISESSAVAITDENGAFTIPNVKSGNIHDKSVARGFG